MWNSRLQGYQTLVKCFSHIFFTVLDSFICVSRISIKFAKHFATNIKPYLRFTNVLNCHVTAEKDRQTEGRKRDLVHVFTNAPSLGIAS